MFTEDFYIVFPEGDVQEVPGRLRLNMVVDANGDPLPLPLPTNRMLAFKVVSVRTKENKGGNETYHYLEQMSADELLDYV
jgi:hypothetical protein